MRLESKERNKKFFRTIGINFDIEDFFQRERKKIEQAVRETIEKFSMLLLYQEKERIKVENMLQESKKKGEIVDFLKNRKPYRDFVVIIIKRGKRIFFNLKVEKTSQEAFEYKERQEWLKKKFGSRFIKSEVISVNSRKTEKELKEEWQKILQTEKS